MSIKKISIKKISIKKILCLSTVALAVLGFGFAGTSTPSHASDAVTTTVPSAPTKAEIVQKVEARFSGLKNSDKVLPVDGGYLYGDATEGQLVNGNPEANAKNYSSKNNPNTITVAKAKELEIKKAESGNFVGTSNFLQSPLGTGISARFVDPPYKTWALHSYDSDYVSGGFGGTGWQYAGYLFYNADYASGNVYQEWSVFGDSAKIGDASEMYYYGGDSIAANGPMELFWPDSGIYLTFYSYYPAPGSGYRVHWAA